MFNLLFIITITYPFMMSVSFVSRRSKITDVGYAHFVLKIYRKARKSESEREKV